MIKEDLFVGFKKLFDISDKELKRLEKEYLKVEVFSSKLKTLSDYELQEKTNEFKNKLANGSTLDDIKYEAIAVCREASKRVLGLYPFKVQVMGALNLNDGNISEMKTGQGKTLTATMAVYLNALEGKGVHVVTVNEYLSERDGIEMGELYNWLGLSVGINKQQMTPSEKKEAYLCDITYTTNSELGFDYLRDNMVYSIEEKVQRPLNYCIIDEVDSILIDEARTPLIISNSGQESSMIYKRVDSLVKPVSYTHLTLPTILRV